MIRLPLSPNARKREINIIQKIADVSGLKLDLPEIQKTRKQLEEILSSSSSSPTFSEIASAEGDEKLEKF